MQELGSGATEALIKSKVFEGNRPTNSIMWPVMTPKTLGECLQLRSRFKNSLSD